MARPHRVMSLSGRAKCLLVSLVKNFVYVIRLPPVRTIGPYCRPASMFFERNHEPYSAVEDDPPTRLMYKTFYGCFVLRLFRASSNRRMIAEVFWLNRTAAARERRVPKVLLFSAVRCKVNSIPSDTMPRYFRWVPNGGADLVALRFRWRGADGMGTRAAVSNRTILFGGAWTELPVPSPIPDLTQKTDNTEALGSYISVYSTMKMP
jgi:hypothetical protein